MSKIYSYVLRFDDGAAPNPYGKVCTLTICKPVIRRNANIGDWVIGTGSSVSELKDGHKHNLSMHLVYAMKISSIKSLEEYDKYCNEFLTEKIPDWTGNKWPNKMGDCIYDYELNGEPIIRKSVHNEGNRERDLSGKRALLSDYFFYFGENAVELPEDLRILIKTNQGHKKIVDSNIVFKFEEWITKFENNKIYADPQHKYIFDKEITEEFRSKCASQYCQEDMIEEEELC